MKKEYDIYLSYHSMDESLAIKIKDSILSYRKELNIYLSNLDESNEEKLINSSIYMPIITKNFFDYKYASIFKKEMSLYSHLEEKGEMRIETISTTYDILFNDLTKLDNETNKLLFESTRGLSFIFLNESNIDDVMESIIYFIDEDLKIEDDSDYKFDVFLSWTWKDHLVKDELKNHFKKNGLRVYDSEKECHNKFTSNFLGALLKSKTYVLLLSDALNREDIVSDVRREIQTATDLEKKLRLNIEIVVLSPSYLSHDFGDYSNVSKFFYDTTGFDRIDATNGVTSKVLDELDYKVNNYLTSRESGKPIFYNPDFGVIKDRPTLDKDIFGRDKEVEEIEKAFKEGNKVVVLSGIGGIGKTKIAEKFAYKMDSEMKNYVQTIHISDILSFDEDDAYNLILSNIKYTKENQLYINSLKDDEKKVREFQENVIKSLPPYSLIIVDNINKINDESMKKIIERLNINLVFTSRITSFDMDKVKVIDVLPFNSEELFNEFKNRSKLDDLEFNDFIEIYDAVLGHTMTLFMLSKIATNYKSKEELMVIKNDLSSIKDKVWVEHNDVNKKLTITEQLKTLFKITDLSDEAQEILLELSLLNDGLIDKLDLKEYFDLDTYNEINELIENGGWLSNNDGILSLNSFLSEIMPTLLDTNHTSNEFNHIIRYIKDKADYSNPYLLLDKAFFALYKLSTYTNDYDKDLYDLFVKATIKTYNSEDIIKKTDLLLKKNYNPIIRLLYLGIMVDRNQNDESLVSEFIDVLDSTSIFERKIAFKYLCRYAYFLNNKNHKKLEELINKTIKSIILSKSINGDSGIETRIRQLMIYNLVYLSILLSINVSKSLINNYIKSEKNNRHNTLYLDLIKLFNNCYGVMKKSGSFILDHDNSLSEEEKNKKDKRNGLRLLFTHPIATIRTYLIQDRILYSNPSSIDEKYLKESFSYANNLLEGRRIDITTLFNTASGYYDFLFENNLTLIKQNDFFNTLYQMITSQINAIGSDYQKDSYKKDISQLLYNYSNKELTSHKDFSDLLVAEILYLAIKDEKAIEYSKLLCENSTSFYGIGSYESLSFILNYANNLFTFNKFEEAYKYYVMYFDSLISNGFRVPEMDDPFVNMLICVIIRSIPFDIEYIKKVYEHIIDTLSNKKKVRITYILLLRIAYRFDLNYELYRTLFNEYLDKLLDIINNSKFELADKNSIAYIFLELRQYITDDYLLRFKSIFKKYRYSLNKVLRRNSNYLIKSINLALKASKDKSKITDILKFSYKNKDTDTFIKYHELLIEECKSAREYLSYFTKDINVLNTVEEKFKSLSIDLNTDEEVAFKSIFKNQNLKNIYTNSIKDKKPFDTLPSQIIDFISRIHVNPTPNRIEGVRDRNNN